MKLLSIFGRKLAATQNKDVLSSCPYSKRCDKKFAGNCQRDLAHTQALLDKEKERIKAENYGLSDFDILIMAHQKVVLDSCGKEMDPMVFLPGGKVQKCSRRFSSEQQQVA